MGYIQQVPKKRILIPPIQGGCIIVRIPRVATLGYRISPYQGNSVGEDPPKLMTGKIIGKERAFKKSGGCNYAVGSASLVFVRDSTATYFDKNTGKRYAIRNLRSGCSNSFVPADGLLNVPCFSSSCVCNYPIQTSFSMYHLPSVDAWREKQGGE